ncbi:hypothetical protein C672_0527 [[Clostridium] bifermentans ATCC 638]|uniref:Peptidase propeptide and YPEB domain protein n=1 Tax=Paraclostridium bifermentans ATCC 638 = DSM 14991 TaxID=1233171 RepID=T4VLF9_PARBF|nr:hypothetical protein [Paraclostridium bifermentans]EQK44549.1 hypothetical protein C672_0527 [[Clostridium] bifermentans ATCC 638] [Paraclostridium bifermentans ATCC 638 = DSM 14991]RIZ57639.1 hypothetical protein CHH45_15470 [Paraclostridium bifermentans]UAG18650.1 hypothetical protein KXZ80_02755 [Paraclostridium bifermentans]
MSKKNIIIGIISILVVGVLVSVVFENRKKPLNSKEDQIEVSENKDKNKIEPISKENALKVLKATYGDGVSNTEEDIKQVGNNYEVKVNVSIEEKDDEGEVHYHEQDMGTHKIDIYTGEIKDTKEK